MADRFLVTVLCLTLRLESPQYNPPSVPPTKRFRPRVRSKLLQRVREGSNGRTTEKIERAGDGHYRRVERHRTGDRTHGRETRRTFGARRAERRGFAPIDG